ncbi:MAG: ATP-dependent DNA helicase RecG [Spirochaetaceae bacterium]|nr:ATP-dependent DNA helicase RecG [Spirochaetaceae bacterium]
MFLRELAAPITNIKGIGPAKVKYFANAGIYSIAQLLCRYPRDWEDRSRVVPLRCFEKGKVCVPVTVTHTEWPQLGRVKTLKVHISDGETNAVLVCFNRPFLEKQLLPGCRYYLYGSFSYRYGELQSSAFEFEPMASIPAAPTAMPLMPPELTSDNSGKEFFRILPLYPLCAGLTQNYMRSVIQAALRQYAAPLENELPAAIMEREGFLSKADALSALHFPKNIEQLELAQKTCIYEELFYLEIIVGKRALERKSAAKAKGAVADGGKDMANSGSLSPLQRRFVERLPFPLTSGQREALADINRDMDSPYPMARLLQGDVGSGKTLVSFMAALKAIEAGAQAVIMAPTELLARQHAENAARLLEPLGVRVAFLTGNVKNAGRKQLLKSLAEGGVDLALGTHALFSKNVQYKKLSLVVIDEQHRFGVTQRQAILAKGERCDLLMMSATPIPRTLALTVFGDMDVSVISTLPPGRKPVETHLARQSNEKKVYDFVRRELAQGRQAYFVYPLIEAVESGGELISRSLKDAESMAERLAKEVFPGVPLALIHSKITEDGKSQIMESFRSGKTKILVATSVVEVGVDVPNASCMVVEHAERFGLSALHQLRGRVGRGEAQSFCFLVYSDELTEDGKQRLKVMLENNDGFVIAEEDLKLRGPGQIAGTEQSGYLKLGIADPVRDADCLARARAEAFAILEADPPLSRPENAVIASVLHRAPPFPDAGL